MSNLDGPLHIVNGSPEIPNTLKKGCFGVGSARIPDATVQSVAAGANELGALMIGAVSCVIVRVTLISSFSGFSGSESLPLSARVHGGLNARLSRSLIGCFECPAPIVLLCSRIR